MGASTSTNWSEAAWHRWLWVRGLRVVETLPAGDSRLVAHVVDENGHQSVVKVQAEDLAARQHEAGALRAFSGLGSARLLVEDEENGILELELVSGTSLLELPDDGARHGEKVGALARCLHGARADALPAIEGSLERDYQALIAGNRCLDRRLRAAAVDARKALLALDAPRVVLHGDFWPANVILVPDGTLTAIDPYGFVGPACYDVAYYSVASRTDDITALLGRLAAGYAAPLPGMSAAVSWAAVVHLGVRRMRGIACEELERFVAERFV